MSNFNSILKEFADAQQAMEQVPILRDEVRAERERNLGLETTVSSLQAQTETFQSTITELRAKIASLEVERDDASFREMATADRLVALQSKISALVGLAEELVERPVAEPTVVSEALPVAEPEVGTAPTTIESAPTDTPADTLDSSLSFMKPVPKPAQIYAGWGRWNKPNEVSWDDFVAGGGIAPEWYIPIR